MDIVSALMSKTCSMDNLSSQKVYMLRMICSTPNIVTAPSAHGMYISSTSIVQLNIGNEHGNVPLHP